MSEILSTPLTARGLGFQDYKPPVSDSASIKTLYAHGSASEANGGGWTFYFGADPAVEEIWGEDIDDWWGKDLSIFLKSIVFHSFVAGGLGDKVYKNAWEGILIDLTAWNEVGDVFDYVLLRSVGQGQFPALGSSDIGGKYIYMTFQLNNYKIEKNKWLELYVDNYCGTSLNPPAIIIEGVVLQD